MLVGCVRRRQPHGQSRSARSRVASLGAVRPATGKSARAPPPGLIPPPGTGWRARSRAATGQALPGTAARGTRASKDIVPWPERRIISSFASAIAYLAADQSPCRNAPDSESGLHGARL